MKVMENRKILQKVLQNFKNITISITKFHKYCNIYCKISKIAKSIAKFYKYCNTLQYYWKNP